MVAKDDISSFGYAVGACLDGTSNDAPAVAIRTNNGAWALHYIHRDHLGSIVSVTNSSGAIVESNSYDAWGRLRNPANLQPYAYNAQPNLLLKRGYTGHEHLPEFGLINMNARLYDPVIGRFHAPDPYVQAQAFSQSFNRYSYCRNNPLIYTDPTGMIEKIKDRREEEIVDVDFFTSLRFPTLAYHMICFVGSAGGFSSYSYSWSRGAYVNNKGHEVPWGTVYNWLYAAYSFASPNDATIKHIEATFGVSYNSDTGKFYGSYVDNGTYSYSTGNNTVGYIVYHDSAIVGFSFSLNPSGSGGVSQQPNITDLKNPLFGTAIATTIIGNAAEQSRIVGDAAYKTLGKISGVAKYTGIAGGVVSAIPAGVAIYNDPSSAGNWARLGVQGLAVGVAFVPVVGWGLSLGITAADYFWGDRFYNWVDSKY